MISDRPTHEAQEAANELELRFATLEEAIAVNQQKVANLEFQLRNLQGQVDRITNKVAEATPSFDEARRERRNRVRYGASGPISPAGSHGGFNAVVTG